MPLKVPAVPLLGSETGRRPDWQNVVLIV